MHTALWKSVRNSCAFSEQRVFQEAGPGEDEGEDTQGWGLFHTKPPHLHGLAMKRKWASHRMYAAKDLVAVSTFFLQINRPKGVESTY